MRAQEFTQHLQDLVIFDIDDTLLHTTARIRVVDSNGRVLRELTNQEFNNYELQPGETFDFGEFRSAEKFQRESQPIEPMIRKLKTILNHAGRARVIMLTARADFDDKEKFLQTFRDLGIDMSRIHVHRAGNLPGDEPPAQKKAVWVRRYLDTGRYDHVRLYDDSMSNLRVFRSLKNEYPDVDFRAIYVGPKGDTTAVNEARKKRKKRRDKSAYSGSGYWGGYYGSSASSEQLGGEGGLGEGSEGTLWRIEKSEATGRYYVVKGYNKSRKIWKNKMGLGDFISKDDAQRKVDELNQGVAEGNNTNLELSSTSPRAQEWIKKVYNKFPNTWQNNHVMSWGEGEDQQFAMFELVPNMSKRDAVEIKWFQAYPLRQGVGSRAIKVLQDLAQQDGISLTLYPWDKGQLSQAKLIKFYKKYGFKPTMKGSKNLVWSKQGVSEGKVIHTYLWHGSRQKIPMLEPRQAVDTGSAAGSNQNAIYVTSDPKVAIAMGLTTPGSDTGMFPNDPQMVLFSGKIRKGEYVYLHKLPFNGPDGKPQFVRGGNNREFHSIPGVKGIKPIEIKKIPVNKYLNLIRKATPADLKLRKKYMKKAVKEVVNPDIFNKDYLNKPTPNVPTGDFEFRAQTFRGRIRGHGDPNDQGVLITAYDPKQPGRNVIGHAQFVVKSDEKGDQWLESAWTEVDEDYDGRGVAAMMYAFAKSLGNDIKPSPDQSSFGKRMWKKWGKDAKHLVGEQGVAEGLSWSTLDEGLSLDDKMAIFEEYAIRGNLTESIDQDKKDYFISLFELSNAPVKNKKYIVAPLVLVGNRVMPLDKPAIMRFLAQDHDVLVFDTVNGKKTYPSKTLRDLSVFNTFTFASHSAYDKFRAALSLKFDIGLPSIAQEQGVAEGRVQYKEIEFVCANPEFCDATDPIKQQQLYKALTKIPSVITLYQDQSEYSEGQKSLSAIYKDRSSRQKILALAKQLGVKVDLERPVSDDYVDRAIRGEHEGQQKVSEAWSEKYKRSINCNRPKGFSQRAHCQGRKKK